MNIRKAVIGTVVAGALTIGGASAAFAADPPPEAPSRACVVARHVLHDLQAVDRGLQATHRRLVAARAAAVEAGNDELVARLDARIERNEAAHERTVTRIAAAEARVQEKCQPAEVPAAA